MQTVLDAYLVGYNTRRPYQGRGMNGRTPAKAFRDGIPRTRKRLSGDIQLCTLGLTLADAA